MFVEIIAALSNYSKVVLSSQVLLKFKIQKPFRILGTSHLYSLILENILNFVIIAILPVYLRIAILLVFLHSSKTIFKRS